MTPVTNKGKEPDRPKGSHAKSVTKTPPKATKTKIFDKDTIQLFQAIEFSDIQIDHAAVAHAVGIKTPAARMRHIRLMRAIRESLAETSGPSDDTDTAEEEKKVSESEIETEETEKDLKALGIRMMKEIQQMLGLKGPEDVEDTSPIQPQCPVHEEVKDEDDVQEGETDIATTEI